MAKIETNGVVANGHGADNVIVVSTDEYDWNLKLTKLI